MIAFFVLSGFLITHLLVVEHARTGHISKPAFFAKRCLRIFPAFYAFALVYTIFRFIGGLRLHLWQVIAALTYTNDYYLALSHDVGNSMAHTWSLAVEEQFYLLWPFLFSRFANRQRLLMRLVAATIGLIWLYRALLSLSGVRIDYIYFAFDTRADALAVGCLTALAIHNGCRFRLLVKSPKAMFLLLSCIPLMYLAGNMKFGRVDVNAIAINALLPLLCAAFIIHSISYGNHTFYRGLNTWVAYYLGVLSYSIYLYHPIVIRLMASASPSLRPVLVCFGSIAVASASYFLIERPFLRLRHRLSWLTPIRDANERPITEGSRPKAA